MAGGKGRKKKDDSSGDDRPLAKKPTNDVVNTSTLMKVDDDNSDDNITPMTKERTMSTTSTGSHITTPKEAEEGWTDALGFHHPGREAMNKVIVSKADDRQLLKRARNFVCPFEKPYDFTTLQIEDVALIPPKGLGGKPNRVYVQLHLHPAWAAVAQEAVTEELSRTLDTLKSTGLVDPIQEPFVQAGNNNTIWISANFEEDEGYNLAAFVYFVASRLGKLYVFHMNRLGYINTNNGKTQGCWELHNQPTISPLPPTQQPPEATDNAEGRQDEEEEADATAPPTQPTDASPPQPTTSTTTAGSSKGATTCNSQLARAANMVEQHAKTWGDKMDQLAAQQEAAMTELQAEEELFSTSKTCLCDIGRIRQPIDHDRLLRDLSTQYPGEWKYFEGYGHRNRRRTLELTFSSKAAVQSVATKGLDTHGLHLDFTMEVPGLVMVSLNNIPTEMPMEDVTRVMERYGEVYGDPFIARKTFGGKSCTIGTRVYGLIMRKDNPVPPFFKVRGHEVTAKYTGMEEHYFPTTHEPTRPSRSTSRPRSRRASTTTSRTQQAMEAAVQAVTGRTDDNEFKQQRPSIKCFACHKHGHRAAECQDNPKQQRNDGRQNPYGRRRQRNQEAWTQRQEDELQHKRQKHSTKLKDGTEVQSFLHPDFQPAKYATHHQPDVAKQLDVITNRLLQSQADRTFTIGQHTDTLASSPRDGPPGTAKVDGKVRQVFSVPLNLYLAFALLETGTFFHVRPFLTKEHEILVTAFSGYMQFGPLGNVNPMTLDPVVYTVAVKEQWAKMDFGSDVDVEAEVCALGNVSFAGIYVDLTHIPGHEL